MKEPETRYDMERMLLEAQLLQVEDRLAELNRTPLEDMERPQMMQLAAGRKKRMNMTVLTMIRILLIRQREMKVHQPSFRIRNRKQNSLWSQGHTARG